MTDAITLFKQAAKELQTDERYKVLAAARKANDENENLQNLLGEFTMVRMELNSEIEKEERDDARITELNKEINLLYNNIMTTPTMLDYNDAKQDMKPVVDYINAIITAAIDGEDPMLVEEPQPEGCGSGCAGCSGCG